MFFYPKEKTLIGWIYLIRPVEPFVTAHPRAGKGEDVAMRHQVSPQVTRLRIFSTAAGYVTIVLARPSLREQGTVGTYAGPASGPP